MSVEAVSPVRGSTLIARSAPDQHRADAGANLKRAPEQLNENEAGVERLGIMSRRPDRPTELRVYQLQ
ncbi:hypothetical protein SynPROS71_01029 [Synechococcus sp. PROS-7-1]|nr:hypothetical protein SynPROS71_01029 [Synechococcus sp. PROS-7-1]